MNARIEPIPSEPSDETPVELIDEPFMVQQYLDNGFLEFDDGRRVLFDKVTFTLTLIG